MVKRRVTDRVVLSNVSYNPSDFVSAYRKPLDEVENSTDAAPRAGAHVGLVLNFIFFRRT